MANFSEKINRRTIHFTDHALDRWWERFDENEIAGRADALDNLRQSLKESSVSRELPSWARVNRYHRAIADHFVKIDDDAGFVINRNPNGDFVAVTFIDKLDEMN